TLSRREHLLPSSLPARTDTLRRLGLGRACIDCAFGAVIERRFNNGADTPLSQRWQRALPRAAATLDALSAARSGQPSPDLGDLAVAVAFDYVDFRLPEVGRSRTRAAVDASHPAAIISFRPWRRPHGAHRPW